MNANNDAGSKALSAVQNGNEAEASLNNMTPREIDERIMMFQENIAKQVAENSEKMGSLESVDILWQEFQSNEQFARKFGYLRSKYGKFRRTRGDGNCGWEGGFENR